MTSNQKYVSLCIVQELVSWVWIFFVRLFFCMPFLMVGIMNVEFVLSVDYPWIYWLHLLWYVRIYSVCLSFWWWWYHNTQKNCSLPEKWSSFCWKWNIGPTTLNTPGTLWKSGYRRAERKAKPSDTVSNKTRLTAYECSFM